MNDPYMNLEHERVLPDHAAKEEGRREVVPQQKSADEKTRLSGVLNDDAWAGRVFERWTVLGEYIKTEKGERKWLCRCACGTQRYVLERALKSGGSLSCGCLRKKKASESVAYDLRGKVFGYLKVLRKAEDQSRNGGIWWQCRCACGGLYETPATLLVTGKRTHCGCKTQKNQPIKDITGWRFSRLTALHPTDQRDGKGSVIWQCRCDCGNEIKVSLNVLMYTGVKSCGCQKKEHDQRLGSFLTHVDGTSVDLLKSKKVPTNNTTGVKGVYLIRGQYVAKIVFQKKQYFLGAYKTLAEAAQARKEAEELLNDAVVSHYAAWSERAEADPTWAEANPVRITVEKDGQNRLQVTCLPCLDAGNT